MGIALGVAAIGTVAAVNVGKNAYDASQEKAHKQDAAMERAIESTLQ
ncbi:hypothetical protein H7097_02885 [Aeromicrobium sp.]|nr:hypothetical protein [Candidatus Saccharibacteria bacterium]